MAISPVVDGAAEVGEVEKSFRSEKVIIDTNPGIGLVDSVGLVVPGENSDSKTRRLLLPTLQSEFYGYSNDINAHNISVPHHYYCCGNKFSWLILIDDSLDMHLYNPLSDTMIQLPSLTTANPDEWRIKQFGKCCVDKAVLSCEPESGLLSETFVLVFYGGNLAFCKLGDEVWMLLNRYDGGHSESPGFFHDFTDAVYYKDKFYLVCDPGYLITVDVNSNIEHPVMTVYDALPGDHLSGYKRYLVESNGELFQVKRRIKNDHSDEEIHKILFGFSDGQDECDCYEDDEDEHNGDTDEDKDDTGDVGETNEHGENIGDDGDNKDGTGAVEETKEHGENIGDGGDAGDNCEPKCPNCGSQMRRIGDLNWDWSRYYRTDTFEVFRFQEAEDGGQEWEEVECLGDRAFFVGRTSSFSVSASDVPGYRPNSIYFTDHKQREIGYPEAIRHDIGVFNLEDETVEDVYPIESKPVRPYPFWFAPFHGRN